MNKKFYFLLPFIIGIIPGYGQPDLLDNVRNNPEEAIKLCEKFKEFNAKGISVNSDEAVNYVSKNNRMINIFCSSIFSLIYNFIRINNKFKVSY